MPGKNVILFSIDDMRSSSNWGHFADIVATPNIDGLMARGTTFTRAISQAPLCNPSRAAVLSGRLPSETGILDNATPWFERIDPADTLPAVLKAAGVRVAMFGKHFHEPPATAAQQAIVAHQFRAGGSDGNAALVADDEVRQTYPFSAGRYLGAPEDQRDVIMAGLAVDFIETRAPVIKAPFFLAVGVYKPHLAWWTPPEYYALYDRKEIAAALRASLRDGTFIPGDEEYADVPAMSRPSPEHAIISADFDKWVDYLHAYLAAVSYADARVGEVLDALAADPALAAETAIVLWSDHGYHLGDKDRWAKFTHWREAAEAPLVIVDPDLPGGRTADQVVRLVDIYPTILDLMDVRPPGRIDLSGESLAPILSDQEIRWADPATGRGVALTTIYGSYSIRTDAPGFGDVRYTLYPDGTEELYCLSVDPFEHVNRLDPETGVGLTRADDRLAGAMRTAMDAALDRAGVLLSDGETATTGTAAAETLVGVVGGMNRLVGRGGDDTYVLYDLATIVETAEGGRDMVVLADPKLEAGFVLPRHVEMAVVAGSLTGNGDDNWIASSRAGTLDGRGGDDILSGGQGAHVLRGRMGRDSLDGGGGDDILSGGRGEDTLVGGLGRDLLRGGAGADRLSGGAGADVFDFDRLEHSRPEAPDLILDFDGAGAKGGDVIDLSDIDANVLLPGDQAFRFGHAGPGGLWTVAAGGRTEILGNVDADAAPELRILLPKAAFASQLVAADFSL